MPEMTPIFSAEVNGRRVIFNAFTGDYRVAAVKALDLAEAEVPCDVKIWCETLVSDYGPYWYRVSSDDFGNLVVRAR